MTALALKLWAGLIGLPRWAKMALVGGAAFLIWLQWHDRARIRAHDQAGTIKAQATASAAADDAGRAVDQTRTKVEQSNDQARKAADRSNDPLRAGLERLRAGQDAPRQPAR